MLCLQERDCGATERPATCLAKVDEEMSILIPMNARSVCVTEIGHIELSIEQRFLIRFGFVVNSRKPDRQHHYE